jgi:hypothetical protein
MDWGVVIGFVVRGIESCGSEMEWEVVIGFIVRGIEICGCDMEWGRGYRDYC